MKVETIIKKIDELDRGGKIIIAQHINKSLIREDGSHCRQKLQERFAQCRKAAEECTYEDFFDPTRKRMAVLTRCMVAYTLLKEGYPLLRLQEVFGKNHSTICHMRNKIEIILELPSQYRDEYNIYCNYTKKTQRL